MISDGKINLLFFKIALFTGIGVATWYTAGSTGVSIMCLTVLASQTLNIRSDY